MLSAIPISVMVAGSCSPVQFVGKLHRFVIRPNYTLDFFLPPHEPVRRPNAVNSPTQVLKLLLPQTITVSRGIT